LVVGAVGIANVIVIAVLEGGREIGVARALGAGAICAALGSAALVGGGSWSVEPDQAVDHVVHQASHAGACRHRAGAAQLGEGGLGVDPFGVIAEHDEGLCGGVGPDTAEGCPGLDFGGGVEGAC
jgi:hypothetical protein